LIAFELAGGYDAAAGVMKRTELFTPAVSLGSVDSLIQHPAGLTHRVVDPKALEEHGISPGMLRASIGLEDAEDLWADLSKAIEEADRVAKRGPAMVANA
jgi:methionine-gamma-lyase